MKHGKKTKRVRQQRGRRSKIRPGMFPMPSYSKTRRGMERGWRGGDQKKEETSVEEKAVRMKKDLV